MKKLLKQAEKRGVKVSNVRPGPEMFFKRTGSYQDIVKSTGTSAAERLRNQSSSY